jgi:hypothetical protein
MVGGTSFHCEILKASFGRMSKSKSKNKVKNFPRSKNKTWDTDPTRDVAAPGHSTCLLTTPTRL